MLTIEQEQTPVCEFSKEVQAELFEAHNKMLFLDPIKGVDLVLKEKSRQFGISKNQLLIDLIEMTFLKINKKPIRKSYERYNYTQKWFELYIEKYLIQNPFTDFFNEYLTDSAIMDVKALGQCMTPNDISNLVATILTADSKDTQQCKKITEFCCGTGSMVLQILKHTESNEIEIVINDIDKTMVEICFIQLYFTIVHHLKDKKIKIYAYKSDVLLEYLKGNNRYAAIVFNNNL